MPTEILTAGGLEALEGRLVAWGVEGVLVISTPSRRWVDEVLAALPSLEATVFDCAKVNVPAEVLAEAEVALARARAGAIVSVGGGAATGLGKALRLTHTPRFAAIPTTYSGSEMTSIYGITTGREKRTGRDEHVRPDLVLYEGRFTETMPLPLSVQGLFNAISHLCSVVFAEALGAGDRAEAVTTIGVLVDVVHQILIEPRSASARAMALRGAGTAGRLLDVGQKGGPQHAMAHFLGGRFALEHAPLHAVLLPHFVAYARGRAPALVAEVEAAIGRTDLEAVLFDALARAGAPVGLGAMGVDRVALEEGLRDRPDLPSHVARDAWDGVRPSARTHS